MKSSFSSSSFEQWNRLQCSERPRNGKSHRCALEICLRCADRERHLLRLFLKPSTILYTHLSAGAKGAVSLCCHQLGTFFRGLSEKVTQLEVTLISNFLWYLFWQSKTYHRLEKKPQTTSVIFKPLDSPIQVTAQCSNFSSCSQSLTNNPRHLSWFGLGQS